MTGTLMEGAAMEVALCTLLGDGTGDPELWAFRLDEAAEIVKPPPITRVPRVDPAIRGLFLLRGRLVTLIDLGARLGLRRLHPELPWLAPQRRAILLAQVARRRDDPRVGPRGHRREEQELLAFGVDAIVGVERVARPPRREGGADLAPGASELVRTSRGPAFLLGAAALAFPTRREEP